MHLARGAVVLKDADVIDAMPRFTPIADPPHGSVLPNTIAASSEPASDNVRLFGQQASCGEKLRPAQLGGASRHYKPVGIVKGARYNGFRSFTRPRFCLIKLFLRFWPRNRMSRPKTTQLPQTKKIELAGFRSEEALGLLATKQTIPSPQALRPERR